MTETEKKALALLNEVQMEMCGNPGWYEGCNRTNATPVEAVCRAIEQHEAFRQEVSDAITGFDEYGTEAAWERLSRFIIPKTDPLVEVIATALREGSPFDEDGSHDYTAEAKAVASAIRARGLEVRKIGEKAGE